jgi:hypothetical protein
VSALLPNAVVLARTDAGALDERFWLVVPGREPASSDGSPLPLLYHRAGGFWLRDHASGASTPLSPSASLALPGCLPPHTRFVGGPYPETWSVRARVSDRRRARAGFPAPLH